MYRKKDVENRGCYIVIVTSLYKSVEQQLYD
jgi:hypothetical protein